MIKRILAALAVPVLFLGLMSCTDLTVEQRQALRDAAIANIENWNAAGFDPVQMRPEIVAALYTSCVTISTISAVWLAGEPPPELNEDGLDPKALLSALGPSGPEFCAVIAKAAGEASAPEG